MHHRIPKLLDTHAHRDEMTCGTQDTVLVPQRSRSHLQVKGRNEKCLIGLYPKWMQCNAVFVQKCTCNTQCAVLCPVEDFFSLLAILHLLVYFYFSRRTLSSSWLVQEKKMCLNSTNYKRYSLRNTLYAVDKTCVFSNKRISEV